jgi:hypothetical protein
MQIYSIQKLIPEKSIVVFSPHFDDVLFMLGGYILELKNVGLLETKNFHFNLIFSRSNYMARSGAANYDTSLERIKLATGNRIIEDQDCNNELLGAFNYVYQIMGEDECFARGKTMADSEMEFPHGMYEDFSRNDELIFERMKQLVRQWAGQEDTALIFPIAIKEHIDHFITREAGLEVAREMGGKAKAGFYFQEDKPYGGIATEEELTRTEDFVQVNGLESRLYAYNPQAVIDLAFKHYITQVEEVYSTGISGRALYWKQQMQSASPLDRICLYPQSG